jgi:hypothetical protein
VLCSSWRPSPTSGCDRCRRRRRRSGGFITGQVVQLQVGMGMTDEFAIGYYVKRLTAIRYVFGWTAFHVARYADLTRAWGRTGNANPILGRFSIDTLSASGWLGIHRPVRVVMRTGNAGSDWLMRHSGPAPMQTAGNSEREVSYRLPLSGVHCGVLWRLRRNLTRLVLSFVARRESLGVEESSD